MSNELKEDIELMQISGNYTQHNVGSNGCKSIVVKMQCGQMSNVPWALICFEHRASELVNLSMVESVTLLRIPK